MPNIEQVFGDEFRHRFIDKPLEDRYWYGDLRLEKR